MCQVKVVNSNLGVGTNTPLSKFQIGNIWTFHDGSANKIIGRNSYWNGTNHVRLQQGYASQLYFSNTGDIVLETAAEGSAGSVISVWNRVIMKNNGVFQITYGGVDFRFYRKVDGKSFFGTNNSVESDPWFNFYHPEVGYNRLRFSAYILSSDSTLKRGVQKLEDATAILKKIKTYSYYYKSDSLEERKRDYGVFAQEIKEFLPELVDTCMETMFVNYNAFIGILIKGFNEQQTEIEKQQNEIEILRSVIFSQESDLIELQKMRSEIQELQKIVAICCENSNGLQIDAPFILQEKAILFQNTPNPFTSNTEIVCHLPETTKIARIYIYNLQGLELKSFSLTQTGRNSIIVYGSELPAGMYLYTLVVDNEIIDTKRMVLTK
jgi:hypothetical protein